MGTNREDSLINVSFASTTTYTFLEEIGRGGMGIVYLGERNSEGVTDYVVLKVLKSRSDDELEVLRKEANVATKLRHENIVKTYGIESIPVSALPREFTGEVESLSYEKEKYERIRRKGRRIRLMGLGRIAPRQAPSRKVISASSKGKGQKRLYMIVMDYIEGTDLATLHREHLNKGLLLPCELTAFIASRMCRALEYAHGYIVHRDISPENILINTQGVAKLSDFGVATPAGQAAAEIAGKLQYMSPEQIRGEPLDGRSDVFSLGLVMFELLTGIPYLYTPSDLPIMQRAKMVKELLDRPIPPPREVIKDVPPVLSAIVGKMLEKDAARRLDAAAAGTYLEQKFLYEAGFGPTNNSLAAYVDIFEKNFRDYTQDQLRNLSFMRTESGKIRLKRRIERDAYTPLGLEMVARRPGCRLFKILFE